MYLGVGKVEGDAEVHGAFRGDRRVEGARGLLESDRWVVEIGKVEVGSAEGGVRSGKAGIRVSPNTHCCCSPHSLWPYL